MPELLGRSLPDSLENGPQRAGFLVLAGSIALVLVSIAASQILLAIAIPMALWLGPHQKKSDWRRSPVLLPLAGFFIWTIAAALASANPWLAFGILKKFFLFTVLFLVPCFFAGKGQVLWVYRAIFAVAFVAAAKGVLQYLANPDRDLLHRISGFMSQWMTYSGLLMLVLVALSAYIMCIGFGRSAWVLPLGFLLIVALALSLTRNSWLGALAGLTVVLALVRPRALGGLLMVIMVLLLISPGKVQYRIRSGMDLSDDNTRNRIELFSTAMRLIRDNPWFGVGPKNVAQEALRYRGTDEYPDWLYQHMHNNFLQIAAERGLPGLALWLWFIFSLIRSTWRVHRAAASRAGPGTGLVESSETFFASTAALGCCAALLVAGLFEYNFGDSEVLMLFLFIVSAPWAFPDVEAGSPA
jgi:putative inorganic carbon (hco3(-)) transporter